MMWALTTTRSSSRNKAYFFAADELRRLMGGCGFEVESIGFEDREMENKKEGKAWRRRWVQAVFRKPLAAAANRIPT